MCLCIDCLRRMRLILFQTKTKNQIIGDIDSINCCLQLLYSKFVNSRSLKFSFRQNVGCARDFEIKKPFMAKIIKKPLNEEKPI